MPDLAGEVGIVPADAPHAVRVVCVDDNAEILHALKYVLNKAAGVECVGTFTSTKELPVAVAALHPDVLLLDYTIPGESTLDALRAFRRDHPHVGCILFSGYDDPETVALAREAGAARCLAKDVEMSTLIDAVRALHAAPA